MWDWQGGSEPQPLLSEKFRYHPSRGSGRFQLLLAVSHSAPTAGPAHPGPTPTPWLRTTLVATHSIPLWSHLGSWTSPASPISLQAAIWAPALMLQEGWLVPFLLVQLLLPTLFFNSPASPTPCGVSFLRQLPVPHKGSAFLVEFWLLHYCCDHSYFTPQELGEQRD